MNCPECHCDEFQIVAPNVFKCVACGHTIDMQATQPAPRPQAPQPQVSPTQPQYFAQPAAPAASNNGVRLHDRNRVAAAVLGILLGGLGANWFYLGKNLYGIVSLLLCWTYIPSIIGLVHGVILLMQSDEQFDRENNYQ